MTQEEFDFWQGMFLASVAGLSSDPNLSTQATVDLADEQACKALAIWWAKKEQVI